MNRISIQALCAETKKVVRVIVTVRIDTSAVTAHAHSPCFIVGFARGQILHNGGWECATYHSLLYTQLLEDMVLANVTYLNAVTL